MGRFAKATFFFRKTIHLDFWEGYEYVSGQGYFIFIVTQSTNSKLEYFKFSKTDHLVRILASIKLMIL